VQLDSISQDIAYTVNWALKEDLGISPTEELVDGLDITANLIPENQTATACGVARARGREHAS